MRTIDEIKAGLAAAHECDYPTCSKCEAAVEMMRGQCMFCKYDKVHTDEQDAACGKCSSGEADLWEWCGPKGETDANGIPLDRLEEICNAERDGRCVVLLCKVGDTVWDRHGMAWEIRQVELHMNGRMWFRCGHKGTDDYTAFSDEYIGDGFFLTEPEGKAAKEQWEKRAAAIHAGATLEEAEAALKEAGHE